MPDVVKLKSLEDDNAKLKRLLAYTMPDNVVLKDIGKELTTPKKRREAALLAMQDYDISQRRACSLVGADPKTSDATVRLTILTSGRR